jgi:hypothetical protein
MAKLRTNQKDQYLSKKTTITSKRQSKRRGKKTPHLDVRSKEAKLQTHTELLTMYELFIKQTGQRKRFTKWLSKNVASIDKQKYSIKDRFIVLFNYFFKPL